MVVLFFEAILQFENQEVNGYRVVGVTWLGRKYM